LWLRLLASGARLELSVRDDGGGFDVAAARRRRRRARARLAGMEERVALAGGSFELRSVPDKAPYCWHHSRSSRERKRKPPDVLVAHPGRTSR